MEQTDINNIHLYCSDAMEVYDKWKSPVAIICDGPYGVNGFPGDLVSYNGLAEWYEPHIKKWSEFSTPLTTLWFWCTEVGWATVHPVLEKYGWEYVSCCVWDKGMSHVAGNTNTKTIRHTIFKTCSNFCRKWEPGFDFNARIWGDSAAFKKCIWKTRILSYPFSHVAPIMLV